MDAASLPAGLRRRREQAVLVRRQQPRQRVAAFDHFEERLLLTEQVLVRSTHDVDDAVGADAGLLHLLYCAGDGFELLREVRLHRNERFLRHRSRTRR